MEKYRQDLVEKNKDGNSPEDAGPVTLGGRLLSSHFPEAYEAISYGRGTWLFHMLRSMLQDGAGMSAKEIRTAGSWRNPLCGLCAKFASDTKEKPSARVNC